MNRTVNFVVRLSVATMLGGAALMWNGNLPVDSRSSVSSADAIIGRPLTPLSYAGVARRTTRRAIVGAGVVGGAAVVVAPPIVVAPVGVAPRCVQAVDPYGRIYTRCY